jgi:hypothetical protein
MDKDKINDYDEKPKKVISYSVSCFNFAPPFSDVFSLMDNNNNVIAIDKASYDTSYSLVSLSIVGSGQDIADQLWDFVPGQFGYSVGPYDASINNIVYRGDWYAYNSPNIIGYDNGWTPLISAYAGIYYYAKWGTIRLKPNYNLKLYLYGLNSANTAPSLYYKRYAILNINTNIMIRKEVPIITSLYTTDITSTTIRLGYTGDFTSVIIYRNGVIIHSSNSDTSVGYPNYNDSGLVANTTYTYIVVPQIYTMTQGGSDRDVGSGVTMTATTLI